MTDKLSEYGWSFQVKVLAAMFVDRTFLQQIADIIQSDYFESDANSWLLDILIDHFLNSTLFNSVILNLMLIVGY